MLRRKYELLEKHVHKLCDKQLKNCGKKLKKHIIVEYTIMNGILTEDINWKYCHEND